ncbi:unnamed protein product [Strongylus vulgaris]|uniref:Uncharacterized protein n=1 Tax=Strongylus vulgaris TaxID=40348 RepID=A0A3P7LZU3_STRVU|nr:unnamed protein product [Strongylus vulgaris]
MCYMLKCWQDVQADQICRAQSALNRLTEVEVSTRILTAAAQHPDLDRISFITSALECHFTEMAPLDEMSQMILRYIHSTGGQHTKIKGIIAVSPRNATLNFEKFIDDENQKYIIITYAFFECVSNRPF